jgi:hypothetical protein
MEQLELPLPSVEDNIIYFEDLTLTADSVLAANLGKFREVFIIGVTDGGFEYRGSNANTAFWSYALDRARHFLMDISG